MTSHASPAQRLFGRVLRSDLPQLAHTLEPFTPSRDTAVTDHIHHKLKQKNAYDRHASTPLPDLPPGSYVYAKPPPNSSSKAWIQVVGPAGPRSYLIDTGNRQIRRNRVQVQPAPPRYTGTSPPCDRAEPALPDKLLPNSLTATISPSQTLPRPTAGSLSTPSSEPVAPVPPTPDETTPTAFSTPPSSDTPPLTPPQESSVISSPSLSKPQTVTHSG